MKKTSNHPQKRRLPLWMTRVTFVAGGLIVLLMIIVSLFPAVFAPYDPLEVAPAARFIAPCAEHPFGTDFYGRDILSHRAIKIFCIPCPRMVMMIMTRMVKGNAIITSLTRMSRLSSRPP